MLTTSLSDFKQHIKHYIDQVAENFETVLINRGKDSGIVIMPLNEYNSIIATGHERSSRVNEKRLDTAVERLTKGDTFSKDLIDK